MSHPPIMGPSRLASWPAPVSPDRPLVVVPKWAAPTGGVFYRPVSAHSPRYGRPSPALPFVTGCHRFDFSVSGVCLHPSSLFSQ